MKIKCNVKDEDGRLNTTKNLGLKLRNGLFSSVCVVFFFKTIDYETMYKRTYT